MVIPGLTSNYLEVCTWDDIHGMIFSFSGLILFLYQFSGLILFLYLRVNASGKSFRQKTIINHLPLFSVMMYEVFHTCEISKVFKADASLLLI